MVKRIGRKLRGASGASVIMALSIMMVIAALSASMLSIAITAPQVAITQQKEEQAYLAAVSTARLLQDILKNDKDKLSSLTNGTPGTTSCTISFKNDSSTLIEAEVKLISIDNSGTPNNTMTVSISAQGYTLENVRLTYT